MLNKLLLQDNKEKGFTVIEILISVSILVIILGAVYATFFTVQHAMERFEGVSLKYREARTALDIIRREIESAYCESDESGKCVADKVIPLKFKGKDIFGRDASELQMTAFKFRGSGLNLISYFVEDDEGILRLVKKESPALQSSEAYPLEILSGIEGFKVEAYFNKDWVKAWDSVEAEMLPITVRVTIDFDDNGKIVSLSDYAKPAVGLHI